MKSMRSILVFHVCRFLALFSLCSVFVAWSTVVRGETELIPFSGYRLSGEFEDAVTGNRVDVDDAGSVGFIVNIDDKPGSAYEFLYSKQSSKLKSGISVPSDDLFDIDIEYFHLGGILLKPVNPYTDSFFGAGLGITHFSPNLAGFSSESELSFSLTGGYKYTLSKHLGFRLGLRAYATLVDSNATIFCREGTCSIRFSSDLFTQFEANAGFIVRF